MAHLFNNGFLYVLEELPCHTMDKGLIEVGYFPNKPFTLNYKFSTLNFSIILSGKGFYEVDGVRHPVHAPCVLVQLPGHHYHYGPDSGAKWEEFYLIYNKNQLDRMLEKSWVSQTTPVRSISNKFSVDDSIRDLKKAAESHRPVDILMHLGERIILETLMPLPVNENDVLVSKIREIAIRLKTNQHQTIIFEDIVNELNISYSTFRRLWYELYGTSPKSYQKKLRLKEACRLLLSTNHSVIKVAALLGFDDPGYFSRIFKNHSGCSPTEYRLRATWTIAPEYQNNNKYVPDESETALQRDDLASCLYD